MPNGTGLDGGRGEGRGLARRDGGASVGTAHTHMRRLLLLHASRRCRGVAYLYTDAMISLIPKPMHMSPCRDSVIAGMMGMGSIIHPVVDFTEAACLSPNPTQPASGLPTCSKPSLSF